MLEQECIPVACVLPSRYCMGRPPWTETPWTGTLWIKPPGQRPPGQRPPWTETSPGQRLPDRDPPTRDPLDRNPPGQISPLDRDPPGDTPLWTESQRNRCKNITFPQLRLWAVLMAPNLVGSITLFTSHIIQRCIEDFYHTGMNLLLLSTEWLNLQCTKYS